MNTALIILAIFAFTVLLFGFAVRYGFRAPRIKETGDPADYGLNFRTVNIPGKHGATLFGWHILATDAPAAPTILIMHGWGVNAEVILPVAVPLCRAGYNALLLDARNHGSSDSGGPSSMPTFAEDIESGLDWLKQQPETGKIALLGHSVGAAATLLVASKRHDMDAVISIASFAHPEWLMQRYLQSLHLPKWLIKLVLRYVERIIGHRFDDIAPINTRCKITCPVLLVHGDADKTIPVGDLQAIAENCKDHKAEILLIPDGDHDSVDKIEQHSAELLSFLARTMPRNL